MKMIIGIVGALVVGAGGAYGAFAAGLIGDGGASGPNHPELVRKGRFDEIFFVDLPDLNVRASILAIHLTNRDQPLKNFDLEELSVAMDGFSGAEIEQAVVSGLYAAHAAGKPLDTAYLLNEVEQTRPLSIVMQERIMALREWAAGRTVPCD